jgi:hypothetical protein
MGAMVGVMTVHATKSTRVDGFNSIPPLAFVIIAPLDKTRQRVGPHADGIVGSAQTKPAEQLTKQLQ